MQRVLFRVVLLSAQLSVLFLGGCDQSPVQRAITTPDPSKKPAAPGTIKPDPAKPPEKPVEQPKPKPDDGWAEALRGQQPVEYRPTGGTTPRTTTVPVPKGTPMSRISAEVSDAIHVRKTLLVWIVDLTTSDKMRGDYATSLPILYGQVDRAGENMNPLLTAVVGYADQPTFVLKDPTSISAEAQTAINSINQKTGKANTFAAVKQAADEYAPFRERGYHLIFVLATGSIGDDQGQIDEAIAAVKKAGGRLFVLGLSTPFSQAAAKGSKTTESLMWERIDLDYSNGTSDTDMVDSGFGPYGLGRLAQETGGLFLVTKPMAGGVSAGFDPNLLKKYAPDYVSKEKYEKILSDNRAKKSLVDAAKLPHTAAFRATGRSAFAKGSEAVFSNMIKEAQKMPAAVDEPIDRMFKMVTAGEADRDKITEPRWQANVDLALGRIYAAKAKVEGYNQVLAIMKNKQFTVPGNSTWYIEAADTTKEVSSVEAWIKKSRMYLERVKKDHAGTPWAVSADRELQDNKIGWTLHE